MEVFKIFSKKIKLIILQKDVYKMVCNNTDIMIEDMILLLKNSYQDKFGSVVCSYNLVNMFINCNKYFLIQ